MALCILALATVLSGAWGAALVQPEHVQCVDTTLTLEVKEARITVGDQFTFSTRLFHYNGEAMVPGPTIHPKAGHSCSITVINGLSTTSDVATCNFHENGPHCPDTTNLHAHNLHVSPTQDDVSSHILPGEELTYTYDIEEDHLMGTQWYHPHYHGSTFLQASGGMAGLLIVEPADSYELPADLDALYNSDAVTYMMFNHWDVGEMEELHSDFATTTIDPAFEVTGESNFITVNAQYQPSVSIESDTAHLFRMQFAGTDGSMELELDDAKGCTLTLLARDGVFHYTPYITLDVMVFWPGNRNDVAIYCPASAAGETITVKANPAASRDDLMGDNRLTQTVVFTIEVGDAAATSIAVPSSEATFPHHLTSLIDQDLYSTQPLSELSFSRNKINNIDYHGFGDTSSHVADVCLNAVYEYTADSGGGQKHPYHQHVNHFQIVESGDSTGAIHRVGEWRDVAGANGDTVRFKPKDFAGEVIMHCHILSHEDEGMMALWNIEDCGVEDQIADTTTTTTTTTDSSTTTTDSSTTTTDSSTTTTDSSTTTTDSSTTTTDSSTTTTTTTDSSTTGTTTDTSTGTTTTGTTTTTTTTTSTSSGTTAVASFAMVLATVLVAFTMV